MQRTLLCRGTNSRLAEAISAVRVRRAADLRRGAPADEGARGYV